MTAPDKKLDDEDELCGCDADFGTDLADDESLPPSSGGVAPHGEGEEADGCDIFFGGESITADEELPASTGGVE